MSSKGQSQMPSIWFACVHKGKNAGLLSLNFIFGQSIKLVLTILVFLQRSDGGGSRKGSSSKSSDMSLLADDEVGNIIMRAGGGDLDSNRTGKGHSLMTSFNQKPVGRYPQHIPPPFTKHVLIHVHSTCNVQPVCIKNSVPGIMCLRSKDRCLIAKRITGSCLSNVCIFLCQLFAQDWLNLH